MLGRKSMSDTSVFYLNRDGGDVVELPVKESWWDFVTKAEKKAH